MIKTSPVSEVKKKKQEQMQIQEKISKLRIQKMRQEQIKDSIQEWKDVITSSTKVKLEISDSKVSYVSTISSWEEKQIIIALPQEKPLDTNHMYVIQFKVGESLLLANVNSTNKILKYPNVFYVLELISPIHKKQSRQHFRLEAKIELMIYLPEPDIRDEYFEESELMLSVMTMDISAGGVKFATNKIIEDDTIIDIDFILLNNQYHLKGRVLTHFEESKEKDTVYRVAFINVEYRKQEKLIYDILLYQRQTLSKTARNDNKLSKSQVKSKFKR